MVAGYSVSTIYDHSVSAFGAVAQLGERMTGSHEVRGSIPLGSTNPINTYSHPTKALIWFCVSVVRHSSTIYSDDKGVKNFAGYASVEVIPMHKLPLPSAKQLDLITEQPTPAKRRTRKIALDSQEGEE